MCNGATVLALYKRAGAEVGRTLPWETLTRIHAITEASRPVRSLVHLLCRQNLRLRVPWDTQTRTKWLAMAQNVAAKDCVFPPYFFCLLGGST